jgi:photosystem II stability/assembly factor-like uncharacterized protein
MVLLLSARSYPSDAVQGWARLNMPEPLIDGTGGQYQDLGCWSQLDCMAVGVAGPNENSFVATTLDGGKTWTSHTQFPVPIAGGIGAVSCTRRGCLVVGENLAENADMMAFTGNGGRSWSLLPDPPMWGQLRITPGTVACSAVRCLAYGSNILSISPEAIEAGSYRIALDVSANNGRTWSAVPVPGSEEVDALTCLWSGECWALYQQGDDEDEQVASTTNGGRTWTVHTSIDIDPDHLGGFACLDSQRCFIVDDSDSLLSTPNGGRAWSKATAPENSQGTGDVETDAMTCPPHGSDCWIVGIAPPTSLWIGLPSSIR